ncbi:MAG TPA: hypothetical protein VHY22_08690 [Chthoniobacteraceae bacterium]|nr:hypothetical protein [Chthoniobacteraceae bacterium]
MSPESLQTFGVLAIGLGFVLIGLGGISSYHASQIIQHRTELREAEQKGEMNAQIMTLLLKNQQLEDRAQPAPPMAPAAPAPETEFAPTPPPAASQYYRPPSPPPPQTYVRPEPTVRTYGREEPPAAHPYAQSQPAPVGEPPLPEKAAAPEPDAALEPPPPREAPLWEEPESLTPETPGKYISVHQRHVIADTLRAHGRHVVTIESSYGDPIAHDFAVELGEAIADADWVVRGIDQHRGLPLASGVTVSAASFPPAPETRAVYEALLSAGIAVTQQLDPKQHTSETLILVGTPL